jgi:hypothetical protein
MVLTRPESLAAPRAIGDIGPLLKKSTGEAQIEEKVGKAVAKELAVFGKEVARSLVELGKQSARITLQIQNAPGTTVKVNKTVTRNMNVDTGLLMAAP